MKNIIGQFSKSDFFSVLPPGFYIFLVTYSCVALNFIETQAEPKLTILTVFELLFTQIHKQPIILIFILFACYMLGSIFRALPVYWAEKTIPPFCANFPYPDILCEVIETLNTNQSTTIHNISKMPNLKNGVPMHVFNYWKDVLCVNSPEGFEYYQSFETRVRFFSGIIWASWSGIFGALYIILRETNLFHAIGLPLLFLSLVLLITYGANFRRIRRQEARALLLIFSAYLQK